MKISANDWLLKLKIKGLGVTLYCLDIIPHSAAQLQREKTGSDMEFIDSRCYN